MIMNSPITSTSLSEIQNQFDSLMLNDTGYKSLNSMQNKSSKQKRNPETQQIKDKSISTSTSPNQQDVMKQKNSKISPKQPETSVFNDENHQEKQSYTQNKFRKSVDNNIFMDNLQSLFKKKAASFQIQQPIQPIKKIQSNKRLHKTQISNHSQIQQEIIKKSPSNIISTAEEQQQITIRKKLIEKSILMQRLKNIHLFYKMTIDQQVNKRKNNDSIFIQMLHQNEKSHLLKVQSLQNIISNEKQQTNMRIKQQQIKRIEKTTGFHLKQKKKQLIKNDQLKHQSEINIQRITQKYSYLSQILQEQKSLRQQVENNQKTVLKIKKWRKQIDSFMTKGHQHIEKLKRYYDKQDEYIDWKRSF